MSNLVNEQVDLEIIRELLATPALRDLAVHLAGAGNEAYLRKREAMQLAVLWPKGWPQRRELEAVE